jgi:CHAT domain-containing protein
MGRLLKQQGDASGAIAAYGYAVSALQSLRSDLVAVNPNVQFNFRESVEPVYRELVGLLLQSETPSQKNIKKSMEVIESLQIAELDNFFREACLDTAKRKPVDQIDAEAAVIYPIILPERLEVILSLPGQPLRNYKAAVPQVMLEKILGEMRQSLNPAFSNEERLKLSRLVYGWLVEPASEELRARNIKTLVFVLDGSLRNLPMAALHDGKQYLVEKYSVALSQGWQLLEPRSIKPGRLKAITAGLSQAVQGFRAVPGVESEVAQISSEVSAKVLLNQEFTDANLKKEIGSTSFPVLHLATHGQFSSNAEDTFILTWDGRINVRELDELLRSRNQSTANPVELLVLSACQTAKGDSRAALGLAGVAVRSGARSTLATLWAVRDQSTAGFMAEFYKQLSQPGVSRAEAVRQAQLALLKQRQYAHPFYWAPFLLVGNWM